MNAAGQLSILYSAIGIPITITRTGSPPVSLTAIRGNTRGQITGDDGTLTTFTTTDWLCGKTQLGELGRPKRGDTITIDETGAAYTVAHPDQSSRVVTPHGTDETAWRIHTVKESDQ
jgi:hypothetical protein